MISTFAAVLDFFSPCCVDLIHADFCHLNFELKNKRAAMKKIQTALWYFHVKDSKYCCIHLIFLLGCFWYDPQQQKYSRWMHLRDEAVAFVETSYFCYCQKNSLDLRNEVPSRGSGCFY